MKSLLKSKKLFAIIGLIISFSLLITPAAKADVGIDQPENGGLISPGQKTQDIQMINETVTFTVKQGAGPFADAYSSNSNQSKRSYAHVKADFTMHNLTNKTQDINVFFPFHLLFDSNDGSNVHQAKNAKITVSGQEVTATYTNSAIFNPKNSFAAVGKFAASFPANADTPITVEYDLRGVEEPKSPNIAYDYMMQTGSNWANNIEHGKVVFEFENNYINSTSPFSEVNNFFKPEDGKLVWTFENLKPNENDDIKVAFDPYILYDVWPKRQNFINSLTASDNLSRALICSNTRANSPDCNSVMFNGTLYGTGFGYQNPSPVNILASPNLAQTDGWLINYKNGAQPWIEFNFDDNYTFKTLQIRPGVIDTNPDYSKGIDQKSGSGTFYDSFRRPKTVLVTFADGTQETLLLANDPQQLQELALKNNQKPTNKLRLTFLDDYPGVNFGNQYFGVGRIYFAGAQKAGLIGDLQVSAAASQPSVNWMLVGAIIASAIIICGLGIGGLIIYRHKHVLKKSKSLNNKESSKHEQ